MTERTTLEIIAPTVEEALAQGLAQLGLPATAVSVEVLDSGNKGLFGLGGRQVRVRLTVNLPGEASARVSDSGPAKPSVPARTVAKREAKRMDSRPAEAEAPQSSSAASTSAVPTTAEMPHDGHDPVLDKTEATISKLLFLKGLQAQV